MKLKAGSAMHIPNSSMRKFSAVVLLIGMATGALGQGTVILQNQTGLVTVNGHLVDRGYVELIAAPVNTPLLFSVFQYSSLAGFLGANPLWAVAGGACPIAFGPGLFSSGTVTINNIAEGANAEYFLIGWSGSATTADAALAGWYAGQNALGESALATTTTGDPTATPVPGFPVSLRPTFAGMILYWSPEPSTSALVGLGAIMLMLFRRRR